MKIVRNSLLALASLTLAATSYAGPVTSTTPVPPAPAAGGFYFSAQGGALWLDDASAFGVSLDFDTGFSVLGTLGYAFGNGLALEVESGYLGVDSADASGYGYRGEVEGDFRQVPIFANVVYTFDLTDRVSLYVGAGAGVVWSEAEIDSGSIYNVISLNNIGFESESEWNFAAQAKAGVSFKLTEAASLNVGYRYYYGKDAVGGLDDAQGSILEGGFTVRF